MAQPQETGFFANPHRRDPYKTFKFIVQWDGKTVMGVQKVGQLKRTTSVITHPSGGDNSRHSTSPGRTIVEPFTMERGITHNLDFENWANKIHPYAGDLAMDLVGYKKELTLVVMNEKGLPALRYFLHGCWVSEFIAVPALDASANAIAIESIKIELEGWERDTATKEVFEGG